MGCERVFGLVAVWAHPCQAHYHSLEDAAHKLVLLVEESSDWAHAFVWLNEALSHVPLSSEGHIRTMVDGAPSADTHGQLHQLQICKLLQHKDMVVCLEGLNGKLEAWQFTFQEPVLWNAAAPSKPACEPELTEVDLSSVQPESMTTNIPVPTNTPVLPPSLTDTVEPPCDITMALNLHLQGALEWLQWASPTASTPTSQCSMPRGQLPSVALGAPPSIRETEDPFGPEGRDSTVPAPMATLMPTSPQVVTPCGTPSFTHLTHPHYSSQLC